MLIMENFLIQDKNMHYLVPLQDEGKWGDLTYLTNEYNDHKNPIKIDISNNERKKRKGTVFHWIQENYHPYFSRKNFQLDYQEKEGLFLTKTSIFNTVGLITDFIEYYDPDKRENARILFDQTLKSDLILPKNQNKYRLIIFKKSSGDVKDYYFDKEQEAKEFVEKWIEKRKIRRLV